MYVTREVYSLTNYKLAVQLLTQTKQEYEAYQGKRRYYHYSGFFVDTAQSLTYALATINTSLQKYTTIIKGQANNESKYQKLSTDIKLAIEQYKKKHPRHAAQRTSSMEKLEKLINYLPLQHLSVEEKHFLLAKAIITELNEVEADHNQDNFSRIFTTSSLAEMYMEVLRDNCIDPADKKYAVTCNNTANSEEKSSPLEVELTSLGSKSMQ